MTLIVGYSQFPDPVRHLNHINLAVAIPVQLLEPLIEHRLWYDPNALIVAEVLINKVLCLIIIQQPITINAILLPHFPYQLQDCDGLFISGVCVLLAHCGWFRQQTADRC